MPPSDVHPLVTQLRFTRGEWLRGLQDVTADDASRRFEPMNCISWMVGHLAAQEHRYWVELAQGKTVVPEVRQFGFGQPASTPDIATVWELWHSVTNAADEFLDTIHTDMLVTYFEIDGKPVRESIGTMLQRNIYHYWYHLGEGLAIRQMLGQTDLPQFVGNMETATYQPG